MVFEVNQGSVSEEPAQAPVPELTDQEICEQRGGIWDPVGKTCLTLQKPISEEPAQAPKVTPTSPETFTNQSTGRAGGVALPNGQSFLGLSPEETQQLVTGEQQRISRPEGTEAVGTAQSRANLALQNQQLAQGVGQFGELGITPTGLDVGEAVTTGVVGSIPSALRLAVAGAGAGLVAGGAAGSIIPGAGTVAGGAAGAVIGGAAGLVGGIASGITSSFKGQRRDTTTAQQRVLDEGKQTMKDWATMARNDPVNKAAYLAEYNKVSAQIDQAFRQMKLDTSEDVAKFETALPNLAEFESFYAAGGERDALDTEMRQAILTPSSQTYDFLELAQRRGQL